MPLFRLAYNTNGLAHHRLLDALRLLAELGYEGVAITPDVGQLDPYDLKPAQVADARRWAEELGLSLTVETGARFLLDARRKHHPNLLEESPEARGRRVEFLKRCVDLADILGADLVSIWAGAAPDGATGDPDTDSGAAGADPEQIWDRLCEGVEIVLAYSMAAGVQLAFEPEPGMFVERPSGYEELVRRLGAAGDPLGLTLDVGHLLCTGDLPVSDVIRRFANRIVHVHLDDVKDGEHVHRMFGEGDLDLAETQGALLEVGYDGQAAVELSRDGHRGAWAAEEALRHLRAALSNVART